MGKMEKHKELLIKSLEKNLGLVTQSCKEVRVDRQTHYRYMREDPEYKRRVDEINEITIDFVERKLFDKISEGEERSILFFMKYKGKDRGYTDRQEIDITSNGKIKIQFGKDDDEEEDNLLNG